MLHIINLSSYPLLSCCLRLAAENDAILFIADGVLATIANTASANFIAKATQHFFVLLPDAKARGIQDNLIPAIELIDYDGFVELTLEHATILSW